MFVEDGYTVASLSIAWIPLHKWEQQMKAISHCLDHPGLNFDDKTEKVNK